MQKPVLGFIGAGKVGHTLARLWYSRGYTVRAIYSQTEAAAVALADRVESTVVDSPDAVVEAADLTLLTVPDDAIVSVVRVLSQSFAEKRFEPSENDAVAKAVIHTSGALDVAVLSELTELGLMVGSLHPAFPFADVETAVAGLPGATFGVEVDTDVLRGWLDALVASLGSRILLIPPAGKATYHSAFVFASNYAVTLYAIAERLLVGLGAERGVADHALNSLLAGTLDNLRRQGVPAALTGPLVRGDVQTIAAHLEALEQIDSDLVGLYRQLARLSLPLLAARHINSAFVEQLLNREDHHASDHS